MWQKTFERVYAGVSKEAIWHAWADVENWPVWDQSLELCQMKSEFVDGESFILKPKGGPRFTIHLTDIIPYQQFTDYCCFWGAKMYDAHELIEESDGVRVKLTTYVTGPLAWLWVLLVAKGVAKSVPEQTENLIRYMRKKHGS